MGEEAPKKGKRLSMEEVRARRVEKRARREARAKARLAAMRRLGIRSDKTVDMASDIVWVYENMGAGEKEDDELQAAPGLGALQLLEWVQESTVNRKQFYSSLVPKALAMKEAREKAEAAKKGVDDGDKDVTLVEVERLLRSFSKEKGFALPAEI